MFKKTLAIVLAIALVAAMWLVPASADEATFADSKFFGVDFSTGSEVDSVGGLTGSITWDGDLVYEEDETLGTTVAVFGVDSDDEDDRPQAVGYAVDYTKLQQNFTMEAYVNVLTHAGYGMVCGTYWFVNNASSGVGISMGGPFGGIIGTGDVFSLTNGNGATTNSFPCGEEGVWSHLVYTHDGQTEALYLNGELVGSQTATSAVIPHDTDKLFRIGGYNLNGDFDPHMKCAFVNLYDDAATAEEVADLYAAVAPQATEAPTEAPTATPEPTEEPILFPEGEDYTVVVDDVPAFKAGDEVKVKFTITDIREGISIVGFDWEIPYNPAVLELVADGFTSSCEEVNAADSEVAWELLTNVDDSDPEFPVLKITLLDDGKAYKGISENDALWVEVTFKALADVEVGEVIAFMQLAEGTRNDMEVAEGTGAIVFVSEATSNPTEAPSNPTEAPANPTEAPSKPGVPATFDIGLISLAAVALSSFTVVKKRK